MIIQPIWLRPLQTVESTEKRLKDPLFLNTSVTGIVFKILLCKKGKLYMPSNFWSCFSLQIFKYMLNEKNFCVIDISASKSRSCLLHLLSLVFWVL